MSHHIFQFLDTNGDGSGNINFNGDYSSAQEIAFIQPGPDEVYRIERLIVTVRDAVGMSAEKYGSIMGGLTNGIQLRVRDDNEVRSNLTNGEPIKSNADWGSFCYDADVKAWGAGDEFLLVRWTFSRTGFPLELRGKRLNNLVNERLEVLFDDDLTGLVAHKFQAQGLFS